MSLLDLFWMGTDETVKLLLEASDILRFLDPPFQEWAALTEREHLHGMGNYAPERPGQTYVRTGNLGDRWAVRPFEPSAAVFVNSAEYATYVVGDEQGQGQAWMHSGRWWTAYDRVAARFPELIEKLDAYLTAQFR